MVQMLSRMFSVSFLLTTLKIGRKASGLNVSFKDKGCFVLDGSMQPAGSFYGNCKLSGKTMTEANCHSHPKGV